MIALLHFLTAIICTLFAWKGAVNLKDKYILVLLASGLGLIHGIAPAFSSTMGFSIYSETRLYAALYSLLGISLLLAGLDTAAKSPSAADAKKLEFEIQQHKLRYIALFWLSASAGVIGFLASFWVAGLTVEQVIESGRFTFRGEGGTLSAIMRYSSLLCIFPGFLGFFISRKYILIGITYAILVALLIFFVSKGSRGNSIGILASTASGFILSTAALCVIFLSVSMYSIRQKMNSASFSSSIELVFSRDTYQNMLNRDPLNYHEVLVTVIEGVPKRCDYLSAASVRRVLFFYLQSSAFPLLKPEDVNITLAREVFGAPANLRVSIPPSVPGDAYVNFWGVPGLLYLFAQGIFLGWLARQMRKSWLFFTVFTPMAAHFTLLGLRGQPYEISLQLAFVFLFVKLGDLFSNYIIGSRVTPNMYPAKLIATHARHRNNY